MAVSNTDITSGPYTGNGITTAFAYGFKVVSQDQLTVYETDTAGTVTTLTLTTDYTVSGVGNAGGGNVTRVAGALPSGYKWYIRANYALTQPTAFTSQGAFYPALHEAALDKLTIQQQQLKDLIDRSFRLAPSYSGAATSILAPLAGSFIRWSDDGLSLINDPDGAVIVTISGDITTVAGIAADVTAVAANATNVNAVAAIDADVTAVGGIVADVTAVAADATNIGIVATNISNVNALGVIAADITTVAGIAADVTSVAADAVDIGIVATNVNNVNSVAGAIAAVIAVDANEANINAAVANEANINAAVANSIDIDTVAGSIAGVNSVATNMVAVLAVNANEANINAAVANETNIDLAVANAVNINAAVANETNIDTVAGIAADVTTVAGDTVNIAAVVANETNINAVAANETNIDTVAGAAANIATTVANLAAIIAAPTHATTATNGATSATNNALAAATSAASIADYSARVQAKLKTRGITGIKGVVISSAEGWEKQGQQSYKADTRPTGRMLGDYATATLAWAANYLGVATATEDYYWNTTTDQQEKCTTSNLSTVTYRGSTDHMPLERAFVFTLTNIYVFDLTSPLMPIWKQFVNAANTLYGGAAAPDWTGVTRNAYFKDGRLIYGLSNGSSGKGLRVWDFKNDTTLHIGASAASTFAGTLANCNSALGMKTVSTATASILQNGSVNGVVDVDGYIGVSTDGGLSVVTPANAVIRSSSTNQFVFLAALRGRLYAVNNTASPDSLNDYGPAAELGASFVPVNTWTTATVPALSDSTLTGLSAAGDHLVIHGSTAVDELWPNPATMADSLIARKNTTAATPPMKKPELMILAGTGAGSLAGTEKITNGGFASDIAGWTLATGSGGTISWVAGKLRAERITVGTAGYQAISLAAGDIIYGQVSATWVSGASTRGGIVGRSGPALTDPTIISAIQTSAGASGTLTFTYTSPSAQTIYIHLQTSDADGIYDYDDVSVLIRAADRSGKSNHATINGTLTLTAHATGGVAMASGFTVNTNYLSAPNPWASIGSGDGHLHGVFKCAASGVSEVIAAISHYSGSLVGSYVEIYFKNTSVISIEASNNPGVSSVSADTASTYDDGLPHSFTFQKTSTSYELWVDGKKVASVAVGSHGTLTFDASALLRIGRGGSGGTVAPNVSVALIGGGKVALTQTEIELEHIYMRNLIEGKAAFDELPSSLAYNELTDTIHCVGTTYEQTMRDGRVVVVGSHGVGTSPVIACGPRGEVSYGGSTNLTISVPERNLHEYVATKDVERFTIKYEGGASRVNFPDPTSNSEMLAAKGGKPVRISNAGTIVDEGAAEAWLLKQNAFGWWAQFAVAPSSGNNITVEFEREIYK